VLVIRLARTGRRNQPKFRVVVAENSKPVKSNVVEVVGHYNPTVKKDPLTISKEAIETWLSKGAQPSNTVARILNTYAGFGLNVKQRPARKSKAELKKNASGEDATADGVVSQDVVEKTEKPSPVVEADSSKPAEASVETSVEEVKTKTPVEEKLAKPASLEGDSSNPVSTSTDSGKEVKTEEAPKDEKPEPDDSESSRSGK